MPDTKTLLLDHAADLIQRRGFNGFSFHDLAGLADIKTASIHYHFSTKAVLGQAVVDRYTRSFVEALGDDQAGTPDSRLAHYAELFRGTMAKDKMCLCGMVSAEIGGLPEQLRAGIAAFFDLNRDWLARVLERAGLTEPVARRRALSLVATLEGALLVYRATGVAEDFDAIVKLALANASGGD